MPRYKFRWSNLPCRLIDELRANLIDGEGDSAELMAKIYGARPKDEFVREAWPTLLDSWLSHDKESRHAVVKLLREARGEDGTITNRRSQMDYLRSLRNAKNLRSIVLEEFIALGEVPQETVSGGTPERETAAHVEKPTRHELES